MSSHNTENETSNQIAPSIYCLLLFRSPPEPQVSRPSAPLIVTFRVSPNPNPNQDTISRAHYMLSATSVAEDVTWWLGMDGYVTRRHLARVWLSLGTPDFRKK